MQVIGCMIYEHNLWFVLMAGCLCLAGTYVSAMLFRRTLQQDGLARIHWSFLSAVTAGAATWATHFIAMLGYETSVAVSFDGVLTVASALVAAAGIGLGMVIAAHSTRRLTTLLGGTAIGLSVAAMHYLGMFAYRVDGIVSWEPMFVAASLAITVTCAAAAILRLRFGARAGQLWQTAGLLSAAIIGLHFTGMTAFSVQPIAGVSQNADSEAFAAMAVAIGLVALIILGVGISTYLVEKQSDRDSESRIAHIALHDALTDLANRHNFSQALQAECNRLNRYGRQFALILIDLDRFKPINDTLGHPAGDAVLKIAAGRIVRAVRTGDMVARMGGDEFAVLSCGTKDSAQAETIAARIVEILARPVLVDGNIVEVSGSVGVALAPLHGMDPDTLIRHADIALYAAKHAGRGTHCLFEPELMEAINHRRSLEAALRRACSCEEFEVVYQPVFESRTGRLHGAEALVRWQDAERGMMPPGAFIPLAEELGLVSQIGALVLSRACRDAASWPDHVCLSVNVSPLQLVDPDLPRMIATALSAAAMAPARLELEITETALLNNDQAALHTLRRIQEMGVKISLDDFGTGYSSLSYLHRYPINRIKIDKSFVQKLPGDFGSASIVRAIAQLGESLELAVTAEGVETAEQLSFIREQGCDHIQGFLTGRPVGTHELDRLARSETIPS